MPIPTYEELLQPILKLAKVESITRKSAASVMVKEINLSEEEAARRIPSSSSTYISNRAGWAMTYLTKAGLISKVEKFTYRITELGIEFLKSHPDCITVKNLREIGWKVAWDKRGKKQDEKQSDDETVSNNNLTPDESIDNAVKEINESLRSELLDYLTKVDPYRFEQIVLDLLHAMGYGGSKEEAAKATKKSNDEGIDGIINEDRLGLDVIYVQAKRWQNTIGRKEIQSFVGALAGQQASKGIFITTSGFADTAIKYATTVIQKVILIDGQRLADLMIEQNIGLSITQTISLKRIDSEYFDEA